MHAHYDVCDGCEQCPEMDGEVEKVIDALGLNTPYIAAVTTAGLALPPPLATAFTISWSGSPKCQAALGSLLVSY